MAPLKRSNATTLPDNDVENLIHNRNKGTCFSSKLSILEGILSEGNFNLTQLVRETGYSRSVVARNLRKLATQGEIKNIFKLRCPITGKYERIYGRAGNE